MYSIIEEIEDEKWEITTRINPSQKTPQKFKEALLSSIYLLVIDITNIINYINKINKIKINKNR